MNTLKMRHQRGRVRPTVRPAELAEHPADRWQWELKVVDLGGGNACAACAHCGRRSPCPSQVYLHGQEGHSGACGGPAMCYLFGEDRYAREHEVV